MEGFLEPGQLVASLAWRYAVKQFDPERTIEAETWAAIEQSLILTPSSYGMQPWKFLVVTDRDAREAMVPACYGQRQVADCSHLVVLCARDGVNRGDVDALLDRTAEVRQIERASLDGFETLLQRSLVDGLDPQQQRIWSRNQVYLALGQLMGCAAALGVDACPMEGFDPAAIDEQLGLADSDFHSVVLAPLGHRHLDDPQAQRAKVRFDRHRLIEHH